MGHTTEPKFLKDLTEEIAAIRGLEGLKERSFGIFYFKSESFLHFHDRDGVRWADVKTVNGFKRVPIGFDADARDRRDFLAAVRAAHQELVKAKGKVPRTGKTS